MAAISEFFVLLQYILGASLAPFSIETFLLNRLFQITLSIFYG